MALSMAEVRERLKQLESKNSNSNTGAGGDKALYPFWNIAEGDSVLLRFLADGNKENPFFWVERAMIKLPFPGVKGQDNKPVTVNVPCGEMYGDPCPVLAEVRPWYKDKSLEQMANKYWKKRTYIFQGFVVENALKDDEAPENPIRRFIIGPQVFGLIKASLMDPDIEHLPVDVVNGLDFRLTKTTKGQYADYSTSKWSRKERALSHAELSAIDEFGLSDLGAFLPNRPTAEHYQAILEMFHASVDGELYDADRWGNFYRPYGVEAPSGSDTQETVPSAQRSSASVPPPPAATRESHHSDVSESRDNEDQAQATATTASRTPDDILNMIRNRPRA